MNWRDLVFSLLLLGSSWTSACGESDPCAPGASRSGPCIATDSDASAADAGDSAEDGGQSDAGATDAFGIAPVGQVRTDQGSTTTVTVTVTRPAGDSSTLALAVAHLPTGVSAEVVSVTHL